jgi:hypothetical protein
VRVLVVASQDPFFGPGDAILESVDGTRADFTIDNIPALSQAPTRGAFLGDVNLDPAPNIVTLVGPVVTLPTSPGSYFVGLIIDPDDTILEISELGVGPDPGWISPGSSRGRMPPAGGGADRVGARSGEPLPDPAVRPDLRAGAGGRDRPLHHGRGGGPGEPRRPGSGPHHPRGAPPPVPSPEPEPIFGIAAPPGREPPQGRSRRPAPARLSAPGVPPRPGGGGTPGRPGAGPRGRGAGGPGPVVGRVP